MPAASYLSLKVDQNLAIAEMAPPRPRFGFIALFGVVTITGAVIFFVHHQQTQERKVILPRVFALSLVYSQVCVVRWQTMRQAVLRDIVHLEGKSR